MDGTSRNELSVCQSQVRFRYCQALPSGGRMLLASSTLATR